MIYNKWNWINLLVYFGKSSIVRVLLLTFVNIVKSVVKVDPGNYNEAIGLVCAYYTYLISFKGELNVLSVVLNVYPWIRNEHG